ncbi:alpha/beta hydrolase, partial [Yersinia pestis subsp. pestis]|nr:alpha/beta hydrolase [Yersinia pestis subsp. pestis]
MKHNAFKMTSVFKTTSVFKSTLLAAVISLSSGGAMSADYKLNPFTLTYDGAITENVKGKVNIHPVTYKLNGLEI